jgi:uncharacterized protein (TIGR02722 family)
MKFKYITKKRTLTFLPLTLALLLVATGCSKKVSRIETNSVIDLSGNWNDADSRMMAEAITEDCLSAGWMRRYTQTGKVPAVIVGRVVNKSHEHINTSALVKDMERSLLNSGLVDFVANKQERKQLREEVADQQSNASVDTRKDQGEEYGADVMLLGNITTIVDQEGGKQVKFYQLDMELIQLESNRKLWIGAHKIKKFIDKKSFGL